MAISGNRREMFSRCVNYSGRRRTLPTLEQLDFLYTGRFDRKG